MRSNIGVAVVAVIMVVRVNFAGQRMLPKQSGQVDAATVPYCELVVKDKKYDGKIVRVRGKFLTDFEESSLEGSDCPVPKDARFLKTWIDFDPSYDHLTKRKWRRKIEKVKWRQPVEVVFVGRYECSPGQGFGHEDMYPSRIVVMVAEYVGPVAKTEKQSGH